MREVKQGAITYKSASQAIRSAIHQMEKGKSKKTFSEIAKKLNVTTSCVSCVYKNMLKKGQVTGFYVFKPGRKPGVKNAPKINSDVTVTA